MLVEPTVLFATAFFAGSDRFIQHFPGASRCDLLTIAGFAGLGSYVNNCLSHKPHQSHLIPLLRKAAAIALGVILAVKLEC